jgi:hypothetical protein
MIAAAAALLALLPVDLVFAQDAVYDLTVKVDATKVNGSPWDGIPGLGTSRPNINAAPDVAVCIVQATGKPQCLWRPQGRRLLSVCQNSLTCKFESVALPPAPVGLLFIDIDVQRHDLIDMVILTGNATAAGEVEVESALRSAMQSLTPALSEDAKERGLHKAKVLPLQQCVSATACRLTQSEFRLEPKK